MTLKFTSHVTVQFPYPSHLVRVQDKEITLVRQTYRQTCKQTERQINLPSEEKERVILAD